MASTSIINQWIDDLASSLLPTTTAKADRKSRRICDNFRRRVRHHNFARTNQFEVRDKLNGLEEKFQVLNRDDLSDALYHCRVELRDCHEQWIPDVLDLLLYLSDDPVQKTDLSSLSAVSVSTGISPVLKWAYIGADEPFDPQDPIWQVPTFSDISSDECETSSSSASTSSENRKKSRIECEVDALSAITFQETNVEQAQNDLQSLLTSNQTFPRPMSELQLIKDTLLMAQGYPSKTFHSYNESVKLDRNVKLQNVCNETLSGQIGQVMDLRNDLFVVKKWLNRQHLLSCMQTMTEAGDKIVQEYTTSLCTIEERILHLKDRQIVTFLVFTSEIKELGQPVTVLARWIRSIDTSRPINSLERLYDSICEYHFTGSDFGYQILLPVFFDAFEAYLHPISIWLQTGDLRAARMPFFVRSCDPPSTAHTNLWNSWSELDLHGVHQAPNFLQHVVQDIFSCGKTICFINLIEATRKEPLAIEDTLLDLLAELKFLASQSLIPFPAAFSDLLQRYFSSLLASRTLVLRKLLDSRCGMARTLEAFEYIYLRKQGALLDAIESRIFTRIDKCLDNWNDRFLVSDMIQDVYNNVDCIDVHSITVHSARTSSRSMESRRRSVRILGALALEYAIPWAVANIIPKASLAAYRRIALHLTQIRRAKYALDRCAYFHAHGTPISDKARDQKLAQVTTFMLLHFVNTIYDHFTTGVALPLTTKMRIDLSSASTVDAMIATHKTYITNLESACLTNKQLTMLRDTLIGLLDMCIRFSDLVSSSTTASRTRRGSDDLETGSFVSAQSQRKRDRLHSRRGGQRGTADSGNSDHDDEDDIDDDHDFEQEGEGYSSFIVLGEDTSIEQEISKIQVQFGRQLDFFIAGLKGVARGGGGAGEFEMLADRLEWKVKS